MNREPGRRERWGLIVGWFVGAFLILAGSFYFVAESWAGMATLTRSLVVFGLTAGYSVGFSMWGMFLARRPKLLAAGRVLSLIGSAIAPLAAIPLSMAGPEHPLVPLAVLGGWVCLAALLLRRGSGAQWALVATTLMMGAAPLWVLAGHAALWANAIPIACLGYAIRSSPRETDRAKIAFMLLAHGYLALLFGARLHLALDAVGALAPLGTYAPFGAALVALALEIRAKYAERNADALDIGAVALQLGCVVVSIGGEAPAFFVTCAIAAATTFRLARGAPSRVRWLYGTFVAGYFAYQSVGQLVPSVLKDLLARIRQGLGYAASAPLPFNFDAVYAVPFIAGGALWGWLLLRRPATATERARRQAIGELLLRCTAVASGAVGLLSVSGADQRAALWSVPALVVLNLALGFRLRRPWLTLAGAGLSLLLPIFVSVLWGFATAACVSGAAAAALGLLVARREGVEQKALSVVTGCLALAAVALAWCPPLAPRGALGLALGGAGLLLVARAWGARWIYSAASLLCLSAIPFLALHFAPDWAPLALAVAALGCAAVAQLGGDWESALASAVPGAVLAALWQLAVAGEVATPNLLGPVLLLGAGALWLAARKIPALGVPAAMLLAAALLPAIPGVIAPWRELTPLGSLLIYAALSLAASIWASRRTASPFVLMLAVLALACGAVAVVAGAARPELLFVAALGALLATRALHPSATLPWGALLAAGACLSIGAGAVLGVACAVTAVAVLPEWDKGWRLLTGGRAVSLAAVLVAAAIALVALLAAALGGGSPSGLNGQVMLMLAALVAMPLVWARAVRWPGAAAAIAPLLALGLLAFQLPELIWTSPLLALTLSRAAEHSSTFRSWMVLDTVPRRRLLQGSVVWSLVPAALVLGAPGAAHQPLAFAAFGVAFLFAVAETFPIRLGAAAVVCAFLPEVRLGAIAVLMGVAVSARLAQGALERVSGARLSKGTAPTAVLAAFALSLVPWLFGAERWELALSALLLLGCSVLLSKRWLVSAAVGLAGVAALGLSPRHISGSALPLLLLAGGAALAAAQLRVPRVQAWLARGLGRLSPGPQMGWASPVWLGAALCVMGGLVLPFAKLPLLSFGFGYQMGLVAVAALLLLTTDRVESGIGAALFGGAVAAALPPGWISVGLGAAGLALCVAGIAVERRHRVGLTLHAAGAALAVLALPCLRSLGHVSAPVAFGLLFLTAIAVGYRTERFQLVPWIAGLIAVHVFLAHLGLVFSTGKPPAALLPYVGLASAVAGLMAFAYAPSRLRRALGHAYGWLALLEVGAGVWLLGVGPAEAAIGVGACGVLALSWSLQARRAGDEVAAHGMLVALVLAYLVGRFLGVGINHLGVTDAIAALFAAAVLAGLRAWSLRGESALAFRRPALIGSFVLPLLGATALLGAPPGQAAAVLVGCAAHFAALSLARDQRRLASVVSALFLNLSLPLLWLGTRLDGGPYFAIPVALSALALIRVFRRDLSPEASAVLRGCAIMVLYVASAWRALTFEQAWPMLVCVVVCLAGVASGVAFRIRSYVYTGTGVLVGTVLANLVHLGLQDHRLGALFLSLLGLLVIGFMVLLTARRTELVRQYQTLRMVLARWQA